MQKLKCELCGSMDMVRTNDGFIQCSHCGCKYTLEQAKSILQVTVDLTKGNTEFQRLMSNAMAFRRMKKYQEAREVYKEITRDFPREADGWFEWVKMEFEWMEDQRLITTRIYSEPIYSIFASAMQTASPEKKVSFQKAWDERWRKLYEGAVSGAYQVDTDLDGLAKCGTWGEKLVRTGRENAEKLCGSGLRYGNLNGSSEGGWLPYKEKNNTSCVITFAIGTQIHFLDRHPYDDRGSFGSLRGILPAPLQLDDSSIQQYQAEARRNGRAFVRGGGVPQLPALAEPLFSLLEEVP